MRALKTPNVLLRVEGLDGGDELALPKDVQRDPIKGFLEHIDLLLVKRGETVTVEIPVQTTGDIAPGGMLDQQVVQISVEAEATQIPQAVEVDVEGFQVGDTVLAKDLKLPQGVGLAADEELLVLHVVAEKTADQVEAEISGEAPEAASAEAETPEAGSEPAE
jgi:large subunit ribosomal protein L25